MLTVNELEKLMPIPDVEQGLCVSQILTCVASVLQMYVEDDIIDARFKDEASAVLDTMNSFGQKLHHTWDEEKFAPALDQALADNYEEGQRAKAEKRLDAWRYALCIKFLKDCHLEPNDFAREKVEGASDILAYVDKWPAAAAVRPAEWAKPLGEEADEADDTPRTGARRKKRRRPSATVLSDDLTGPR